MNIIPALGVAAALFVPSLMMGNGKGAGNLPPDTHFVQAEAGPAVRVGGASVIIASRSALILVDPVGPQSWYRPFGRPDIVILTSAAPDHLSTDTMIGLLRRDTVVLAPQSVIDQLPLMISNNVIAPFEIGSTQIVDGIRFTAVASDAAVPADAAVYERTRGDLGVLIVLEGETLAF